MRTKFFAMVAASALAIGIASSAQATTRSFDLSFYAASFTGSLGTISVDDFGATGKVTVDVSLNNNVFFQLPGDGLWFDLDNGADVGLTSPGTAITTPAGGVGAGGSAFAFRPYSPTGAYRATNGFLGGFHYGLSFTDSTGGKDYYTGHLIFDLTAPGLSAASFTGQSETVGSVTKTAFFGADLRQCPGTDPKSTGCITGPAGAVVSSRPGPDDLPGVPEPATWAMMIIGFGGVGGLIRRRRMVATAA